MATRLERHPSANWEISGRYTILEMIGEGSYGTVCEAEDAESGKVVAIKRCRRIFRNLIDGKRVLREIAILDKLRHENVVRIIEICVPRDLRAFDEIYFVQELADSDLKQLCKKDVTLTALHINTMLYHLLCGLKFIHSAGIYHRDLKPANCFVNQDCTVKIGDFGLARAIGGEFEGESLQTQCSSAEEETCETLPKVSHTQRLTRTSRNLTGHVATRQYRAPELILLQEDYTESVDYWSVGCIYAELLGMLEGTRYKDRGHLFRGRSCFPLSPNPMHRMDYKYHVQSKHDMLNTIFDIIGTPSEAEVAALDGDDAKMYISCFTKRPGSGLSSKLPHVDEAPIDMLTQLLRFNPAERLTRRALEHPVVQNVRNVSRETVASGMVKLEFEKETELTETLLRREYLREVRKYHQEVPEP